MILARVSVILLAAGRGKIQIRKYREAFGVAHFACRHSGFARMAHGIAGILFECFVYFVLAWGEVHFLVPFGEERV